MLSILFLCAALFSLALSASAWWRLRDMGLLNTFHFFAGWLGGELALQRIVLGVLFTLLCAAQGVLNTGPGQLGLAAFSASWLLSLACHIRSIGAGREVARFAAVNDLDLGDRTVSPVHGLFGLLRGLLRRLLRRGAAPGPKLKRLRNIPYGESLPGDKGRRNLLDVVLAEPPVGPPAGAAPPSAAPASVAPRPALLHVHGGGWVMGNKNEQGKPLMRELAKRGWVCFDINYRLSPKAAFPAHIIDVKRALAFIRGNAERYGIDPNFVCITGGSAGGHLTALAALSQGDPRYQPGFETADTRVQAALPVYGVFDWRDRAGDRGRNNMAPFIAKSVMQCAPEADPEGWDAATPLLRALEDAPPMMVVQGTHDSLVFVEEARTFVKALKGRSRQPVLYLELEGAQHAFEVFESVRTGWTVLAASAFLEKCYAEYRQRGGNAQAPGGAQATQAAPVAGATAQSASSAPPAATHVSAAAAPSAASPQAETQNAATLSASTAPSTTGASTAPHASSAPSASDGPGAQGAAATTATGVT